MEEDDNNKMQKDGATSTSIYAILPQLKGGTKNAGKEASQRLPVGGATTSGGTQAGWPTVTSEEKDIHASRPQFHTTHKDDTRTAGKKASQRLPVGGATTSGGIQASWPTATNEEKDIHKQSRDA